MHAFERFTAGSARLLNPVFVLLSLSLLVGCSSGLECEDGEFYLDGEEFEDCEQCPDPDSCFFEGQETRTGSSVSGTVTAHCEGETATIRFEGSYDNATCE